MAVAVGLSELPPEAGLYPDPLGGTPTLFANSTKSLFEVLVPCLGRDAAGKDHQWNCLSIGRTSGRYLLAKDFEVIHVFDVDPDMLLVPSSMARLTGESQGKGVVRKNLCRTDAGLWMASLVATGLVSWTLSGPTYHPYAQQEISN